MHSIFFYQKYDSLLCLINSTKLKPHFLRVNLSTVLYDFIDPHSLPLYDILQLAITYPLRKLFKQFLSPILVIMDLSLNILLKITSLLPRPVPGI